MSTTLTPLTFPPDLYKRLVPGQFLSRHLAAESPIRPDSRQPADFRDVQITTNSLSKTNGSSVVRIGSTIMSCGIRAEVTEPDPFAPKRGYIVPNIDIGPLCHSSIKAGPPSDLQQSIAYALIQTLQSVDILDYEQLCIEQGKAVWILYIDIICLSHSGSLFSAASLAMVAALMSTSLPVAVWEPDLGQVTCRHEYAPLKMDTTAYVVEFGVFEQNILADMTDEEELLCKETVIVTMGAGGIVRALKKSGGAYLGPSKLDHVLELAERRANYLDGIVRSAQKYKL